MKKKKREDISSSLVSEIFSIVLPASATPRVTSERWLCGRGSDPPPHHPPFRPSQGGSLGTPKILAFLTGEDENFGVRLVRYVNVAD